VQLILEVDVPYHSTRKLSDGPSLAHDLILKQLRPVFYAHHIHMRTNLHSFNSITGFQCGMMMLATN
jgi:hypothetical protein